MKFTKILSAILLLLLLTGNCLSQDTNIVKYLPLKVGNVWVYYFLYTSPSFNGTGYDRYKITGTSLINGKTYFNFLWTHVQTSGNSNCTPTLFPGNVPIRIDSINGNIYKSTNCGTSSEYLYDSLKAKLHDTVLICNDSIICSDTALVSIFGSSRQSKSFSMMYFEQSHSRTYVKNIGISSSGHAFMNGSCGSWLLGCVINGIKYGDTAFPVGINQISAEIPNSFSLSQNYPNPFNPSTKIKFDIPHSPLYERGVGGFISLKIFDILGNEVATLVNEQLKPGTYEVEWPAPSGDGSNFSSGVYFFKLETVDFTESKKMMLLK